MTADISVGGAHAIGVNQQSSSANLAEEDDIVNETQDQELNDEVHSLAVISQG